MLSEGNQITEVWNFIRLESIFFLTVSFLISMFSISKALQQFYCYQQIVHLKCERKEKLANFFTLGWKYAKHFMEKCKISLH